ncbi:UvrABC system protein B [Mesoplasma sp. JKS002658]|uniref:DEAD/DEAH box helicase family protein n=1 Tax=Mesoplasma whartonense TaxID=2878854 RepID=UPI002022A344|nr:MULTISPECIES: DEAD/DEAH box helicase family protein [unclassified Mesoplasma]MCL8211217.1 UvrABC system protein B [Mesoplasma sp. JKS002664]MCL8211878.1 UvrABC system protein B [Mesoplasma sp. JKS002662]MCL8214017.1 UvrABC system protein B [Mesoplasma sp. JKS002658]MCL8214555.1 UvrABC system protein B [Mesoplasma sp. JKS002663]MCL8215336.1 UvrABC system protein B [Mesoplasma sp. JKS002659]
MGKDYLELLNNLTRKEENKQSTKVDVVDVDNEWIINQFSSQLRAEFDQITFNSLAEKLDYLNKRFNYQFNAEVVVNKHQNTTVIPELSKNLSMNELITSRLYHHLHQNAQTADEIYLISPFISQPTVNKLRSLLENDAAISLKIITTTYDGNSSHLELRGLQRLYQDYPSRVAIRIENLTSSSQERLHIKNYFFKRNHSFSTAFIGSSNLTYTGVVTGKEYNLKISEFREPSLIKTLEENFFLLWNDPGFVDFSDHKIINELIINKEMFLLVQEQNATELRLNHPTKNTTNDLITQIIKPFAYQQEILDVLNQRIEIGKNKHLIVMATGTGKTALVAFFYKQLFSQMGRKPKLLYISHQQEILSQARRTFQSVLKDHQFGVDFYDGSSISPSDDQIFATIQTLSRHLELVKDKPFDLVVYDEAHHIQASTYKQVYETLKAVSSQIIGLTATPKRTEGFDVKDYFFDGEYAYQLDLATALNRNLLSNFDYYFIKDDSVDLHQVDITTQTKLLSQRLSSLKRNEFVYENLVKYIGLNRHDVSVLIFCVDINHANSVANYLSQKNERVAVLFGETNKEARKAIIENFKHKAINYLCVVDIFNEGVDIPNVDRLFLLRPTSSLIVYLQQLGRGLRKFPGKRLEVFDFINNIDAEVNKNYNPFIFLEPLMSKDLNNKQVKDLKVNFDKISGYVAGDSLFHFEKASKNFFKDKVAKMTQRSYLNRIAQLLESYWENNVISYENYEEFVLNNFDHVYQFYAENNLTWLKENKITKLNGFRKISDIYADFTILNNSALIRELQMMIQERKSSDYLIVNGLVSVSLFAGLKEYEDCLKRNNAIDIWEVLKKREFNSFLRELEYILKFKLSNEDLIETKISNETEDYVDSTFTKRQALTITKVLYKKYDEMINWKGGKVTRGFINGIDKNRHVALCSAYSDRRNGYKNEFNHLTKELVWFSPAGQWLKSDNSLTNRAKEFEDTINNKVWFIYANESLWDKYQGFNGDRHIKVFRLLGRNEQIVSKENDEINSQTIRYVLKISNR